MNAQSNPALSSWGVDIGGIDGITYSTDSFNIVRAPPGGTLTRLLSINSSGNVGIGSTSPPHLMTVTGGNLAVETGNIYLASGHPVYLDYGATNNYGIYKSGTEIQIKSGGNFYLNGTNLGIGITAPGTALTLVDSVADKIQLNGNNANAYKMGIATAVNGGDAMMKFTAGATSAGEFGFYNTTNARLFIANGGSIGIGTTSPGYKLDVAGDINSTTALRFSGTQVCTSAGCTAVSDRNLKENIQPLKNSLDKILSLAGVQYDWIDQQKYGHNHQIGLIAQDLEKIYPEVVLTDSQTGLKSVAYDHLVAPLIEAIKETSLKNQNLEAKVNTLNAENELFKERLIEIEKTLKALSPKNVNLNLKK